MPPQYLRTPNSSVEPMSHLNSKSSNRGSTRAPLGQRSTNTLHQAPSSSVPVKSKSSQQHKLSRSRERESNEPIEIEELRRKPNGEGHTVHRYLRGKMLGKGGFAKVYLCTSLDTNRSYAVKVVPKANLVKSRARQKVRYPVEMHYKKMSIDRFSSHVYFFHLKLQAEIKIHRLLKHKHVCEYKHFFEDKTNCYILLELCQNQSMNELLKRRKRLTEPEVKYYLSQLLMSVQYMHGLNVIHRDLKLGNLFLDKQLRVKVGDFGLATKLSTSDEKRKTICGTPNYIAPEVIEGDKEKRGHSFEVDVWSMGVICFTLLVGKPPYESKDVKSTYQRILRNEYSFPSHIPISEHARDLISSMLQTRPDQRYAQTELRHLLNFFLHTFHSSDAFVSKYLDRVWRQLQLTHSLLMIQLRSRRACLLAALTLPQIGKRIAMEILFQFSRKLMNREATPPIPAEEKKYLVKMLCYQRKIAEVVLHNKLRLLRNRRNNLRFFPTLRRIVQLFQIVIHPPLRLDQMTEEFINQMASISKMTKN